MSWKKITVRAEGNTDETLVEALEDMLRSVREGNLKGFFKKQDVGKYASYSFEIQKIPESAMRSSSPSTT